MDWNLICDLCIEIMESASATFGVSYGFINVFLFILIFAFILNILIHYIGDNLKIASLNNFINEYFPTSIFAIIGKYSSGVVYDILSWVLVLFLIWFLIYLVKYLFGCR